MDQVTNYHQYKESLDLGNDPAFNSMLFAMIRKADTKNTQRLKDAFPLEYQEFFIRYNNPAGYLVGESYKFDYVGIQIIYLPDHAHCDVDHPDAERGFVECVGENGTVYCRYWRKDLSELRTKANAEGTPRRNLMVRKSVALHVVSEWFAQREQMQ